MIRERVMFVMLILMTKGEGTEGDSVYVGDCYVYINYNQVGGR